MLCGVAASWWLCKADRMLKAECGWSDVTISILPFDNFLSLFSNIVSMLQFPTCSPYTTIISHSLHVTTSWYDCNSSLFLYNFSDINLTKNKNIDVVLFLTASHQHYFGGILFMGVYSLDVLLFWPIFILVVCYCWHELICILLLFGDMCKWS